MNHDVLEIELIELLQRRPHLYHLGTRPENRDHLQQNSPNRNDGVGRRMPLLRKLHRGVGTGMQDQPDVRQRYDHAPTAVEVRATLLRDFVEIAPGENEQIVRRRFGKHGVGTYQEMRSWGIEAMLRRRVVDHVLHVIVSDVAVLDDRICTA